MIPTDSVAGVLLLSSQFFPLLLRCIYLFLQQEKRGHMAYIHDSLNDCNRNDFMTVRAKEGMYTKNKTAF
jgi:hypothetical protein